VTLDDVTRRNWRMMKRSLPFLLLLLGAAGCDRPLARVAPPEDAVPASVDTATRTVAATTSPVDTTPKAVLTAVTPTVDTTHWQATPAMLAEACDAFATILAASAAANGMPRTEVGTPRDTAMTFGGFEHAPVEPACRVAWRNEVARGAPLNDVIDRAFAAGWTERGHLLGADGPDGSVLAVSRGNVACLIEGSWDGGDDSDSTYVPSPGFEIAASCFVNRPDRH
jgi:hypothetical protein